MSNPPAPPVRETAVPTARKREQAADVCEKCYGDLIVLPRAFAKRDPDPGGGPLCGICEPERLDAYDAWMRERGE
jgi:hypothetical protein